jgi:ABC-type sugar transport system ATPase subunit
MVAGATRRFFNGKARFSRTVMVPDVAAILFDEPLTVIDPHLKWQLRSTLKELHRKDEVADEGVGRALEQLVRRAGLHHRPVMHHHHRVGEGQKISLGRGLVRPDVAAILFDEPLTVIDPHLKWHPAPG